MPRSSSPVQPKVCDLLNLPSGLVGKLWPAERVVAGLRVCRQLHQELSETAGNIVLVKGAKAADFSEDALVADFRRISHRDVALKWRATGRAAGLMCVASMASLGRAIVHLDLTANSMGVEGAGMLAGMLSECTALNHLDLCANQLGDKGAGRLAEVLGTCRALSHLALRDNQIGEEGAASLAGALEKCSVLAHLDLSVNVIGDGGAGRFAGVLKNCKALAHLALRHNEIGDEGVKGLAG
eukprot:2783114-Rhodomonas_salina.2